MMREDYTVLSEKDEIEEFMFLGLRKRAGISEREFKERFRVGLKDIYGKVINGNIIENIVLIALSNALIPINLFFTLITFQ